jgi:hypothetical protein
MDTDRIIASVGEALAGHGDELNRIYIHLSEVGLGDYLTAPATAKVRKARDACWTASCELLDLARSGAPIA